MRYITLFLLNLMIFKNLKYSLIHEKLNRKKSFNYKKLFKKIFKQKMSHNLYKEFILFPDRFVSLFKLKIDINNDGNLIELGIDTGSQWLWVYEDNCSTCSNFQETINYNYLDGGIRGNIFIKDIKIDNEISHNHYIMTVNRKYVNGIVPLIGLSPQHENYETFLQTIYKNGLIDSLEFSIDLNPKFNYKFSNLIFGTLEDNNYELIVKTPLISSMLYLIKIENIKFNQKTLEGNITGVIDSGNTLIALPKSMADDFILYLKNLNINCKLIPESNQLFESLFCSDLNNAPVLNFQINGIKISLEPEFWATNCINSLRKCETRIEFHSYNRMVILGIPLFEKYIVNFNYREIGFYQRINN